MNNKVNSKEFLEALNKVIKAVDGKHVLPIMREVKVEFQENECILTGSNINQFITTKIPASGDDFGFVFYDTKSIIKASKYFADDLVINFEDKDITLWSNKKSCKQIVSPADIYPKTPIVDADQSYTVSAASLINRYDKIKYAVSKDENRGIIAGVCFRGNKLIALDGFRMAINTDESLEIKNEFTVPSSALALLNVFGKNAEITLNCNHKIMSFTDGMTTMITRLIEGDYIKTDEIIPKDINEQFNIIAENYTNELKYLSEFVATVHNQVIKFEKGTLIGKNNSGEYSADAGFGKESGLVYGFNCSHMLDALNQFKKSNNVVYRLTSKPTAPITIVSDTDLALVLPVRISA